LRLWGRDLRLPHRVSAAVAVVAAAVLAPAAVAGPPEGYVRAIVANGFEVPTAFAYAPDGRIFVIEKAGVVKVVRNGRVEEFADLRDEVNGVDDRGLLGLALDPEFAENGWIYLAFTKELRPDDPDKRHPAGGAVVRVGPTPGVRRTILEDLPTPGVWHSVGDLDFDADGRLLVGMGDGSPYWPGSINSSPLGRTALRALDLDSANGKVLRVDPATGLGVPDNPFYDAARPDAIRSKVLAYGLRNPFRFVLDRDVGDLWIADPGSSLWEELNRLPDGFSVERGEANFGWPCYEGGGSGRSLRQPDMRDVPQCRKLYRQSSPPVAAPEVSYHLTGAAIIGGAFYRGKGYPVSENGALFLADVVHDTVFTFEDGTLSTFGTRGGWGLPVDIGASDRGNVAYLAITTGELWELVYQGDGGAGVWPWLAIGALAALALAGVAVASRRAR
jgi:glucose/arabinose dehydrogenase